MSSTEEAGFLEDTGAAGVKVVCPGLVAADAGVLGPGFATGFVA